MYAIVDIAGQQFKVEKGQEIFVHRLEDKEGSKVNFDGVLLVEDGGKISVGTPFVKGITVSAKILSHDKADKITVFKKKRRKGYQKENGHRQYLSKIQIEEIGKPAAIKAEPKKEAEPQKEVAAKTTAPKKKASPKKETAAKKVVVPKKETTAKKAAPKKAASKDKE